MNLDQLQEEIISNEWKWWTNGLEKGLLQVNIYVGGETFSYWPFSAKRTFWHRKSIGTNGPKITKLHGIQPEEVIILIKERLEEL